MTNIKEKLMEDIQKMFSGEYVTETDKETNNHKSKVYTVDIGKMKYIKTLNRPMYISANPYYVTIDQIIEMTGIQFLEMNI